MTAAPAFTASVIQDPELWALEFGHDLVKGGLRVPRPPL